MLHNGKLVGNFPDLNKGMMLTAKQESDPENYDVRHLCEISNRKGLAYEPQPIPDFYLTERQANVYSWTSRNP